jgi:hypothetical protein
MGVKLVSASAGSVEIVPPTTASNYTATLPAGTGTMVVNGINGSIVSGTAVASTSGTSIDFTSIPSWVKRITVMFNGTSLNASGAIIVQIGSGSFTTSGYSGAYGYYQNAGASTLSTLTTGFGAFLGQGNSDVQIGTLIITNVNGNNWISSINGSNAAAAVAYGGNGAIALGGALDRVRITTVAGTATFDAGSINILYE